MEYVIQILLPQRDNADAPFSDDVFTDTRRELVGAFGGLTAWMRAPARGLWKEDDGTVSRDDIVVFEVMAPALDRGWWAGYRRTLERRFRQHEVVVRATAIERL